MAGSTGPTFRSTIALLQFRSPSCLIVRSHHKQSALRIGLVGYGENWGTLNLTDEKVARYIGSSPFDWINDTANLELNMAMYDLMGKYLEVPAWKLIGPQVRSRIPVAAWTVSQVPEALAEEVKQAHSLGYRWLKYHCDEVQNVEDQVAAAVQVGHPDRCRAVELGVIRQQHRGARLSQHLGPGLGGFA